MNLKRKHWKGEDGAEKTSQRLSGVFQRQMQDAEAVNKRREAAKTALAEAFRYAFGSRVNHGWASSNAQLGA